jgi:hypothetical protein
MHEVHISLTNLSNIIEYSLAPKAKIEANKSNNKNLTPSPKSRFKLFTSTSLLAT